MYDNNIHVYNVIRRVAITIPNARILKRLSATGIHDDYDIIATDSCCSVQTHLSAAYARNTQLSPPDVRYDNTCCSFDRRNRYYVRKRFNRLHRAVRRETHVYRVMRIAGYIGIIYQLSYKTYNNMQSTEI